MPVHADTVPALSFSEFQHGGPSERARFGAALFDALRRFGFVIIRDHGVAPDLLDQAYMVSADFFALPEAEKSKYRGQGGQRGYTPFGVEHAKDHAAPDLKEFWHVGPERPVNSALGGTNIWPERPAAFRPTFTALYNALHGLGEGLLEALTPSLDLSADYFTTRVAAGDSILRLLHYPPVRDTDDPASLRAAPHEDINLITLLVAAEGAGLELLDRDGRWLPVESNIGDIVVDTGDMMARLTNEVLPSTTHRVVKPDGPNISRYSMPFFMHFAADVSLKCLPSCEGEGAKYAETTAGAYLIERLRAIGLID